jgi:hypothetical protein
MTQTKITALALKCLKLLELQIKNSSRISGTFICKNSGNWGKAFLL